MDVESEEHEAPQDVELSILDTHPSDVQREEPVDLVEPMDRSRDVAVVKRRPLGYVILCSRQRSMQLPMVLSGRAGDLRDSRVIWC